MLATKIPPAQHDQLAQRHLDLRTPRKRRHPLRVALAGAILFLFALLVRTLLTEENLEWSVVAQYLTDPMILRGVVLTLELTALAMLVGIALGVVLAAMRMSENPVLRVASSAYIALFRGTPALIQLIFWFNIALVFPRIEIGAFGIHIVDASTNQLMTPLVASILGLGLNEAAYTAELVRGGLLSVPRGQTEAGKAIGMAPGQIFRMVVLSQAVRVIVPSLGNQVIGMLKYTSLASFVTLQELLYSAQTIYSRTLQVIPLLIVAAIWYFVLTSILTVAQSLLERRLGRSLGGPATEDQGKGTGPSVDPQEKPQAPPLVQRRPDEVPAVTAAETTGVNGGRVVQDSFSAVSTSDLVKSGGATAPQHVVDHDDPVVRFNSVSKAFGRTQVLSDVTFDVARGEVCCIIGPSGGGKTTLLRCVNGLEHPDSGCILVDGERVGCEYRDGHPVELSPRGWARQRASTGMVFQHFNLFPNRTVLDNVTLGPIRVAGVSEEIAEAEALALLERVGVHQLARRYPSQISGGQQQRVAIARALAMKPKVLLFDEPTSALDPELVGEVLAAIRSLTALGISMIIVTHEIAFAREVSDKVLFMHQGVVVEGGSPEQVIGNPVDSRIRTFLARTGIGSNS
jgi:polar amino acid transport system permease protein